MLQDEHMKHQGKNSFLTKILFVQTLRQKPQYGSHFFKVKNTIPNSSAYFQQTKEGNIIIGINNDGVHLQDPLSKKIERTIAFKDIINWEVVKGKYFWMEVTKNDVMEDYILSTPQAELIKETLIDIVYELKKKGNILKKW